MSRSDRSLTLDGLDHLAQRAGMRIEPEAREGLLRRVQQLEREVRSFEPVVEPEDEPLASLPFEAVEGD